MVAYTRAERQSGCPLPAHRIQCHPSLSWATSTHGSRVGFSSAAMGVGSFVGSAAGSAAGSGGGVGVSVVVVDGVGFGDVVSVIFGLL